MEPTTRQNLSEILKEVEARKKQRYDELEAINTRAGILRSELEYLDSVLSALTPLTNQDRFEPVKETKRW